MDRSFYKYLRTLDRHELRRILVFARGLLLAMGDDAHTERHVDEEMGRVTYRLETVRCGRAGCRSCPHGPYWYAYWREDGKLRSRYIGVELPEEVKAVTGSSASRS